MDVDVVRSVRGNEKRHSMLRRFVGAGFLDGWSGVGTWEKGDSPELTCEVDLLSPIELMKVSKVSIQCS